MANENTASLLAQLREIHLPPAPPEPSVWPTIAAIILATFALIVFMFKSRIKNRQSASSWSKEAIRELNEIKQFQSDTAIQKTASLLKRIVLTHDSSVRHLTGDDWLLSLDFFFNTSYFTKGDGQIFGGSLYTNSPTIPETLYRDIEKLIRKRNRQP